jgi:hypothetical protein
MPSSAFFPKCGVQDRNSDLEITTASVNNSRELILATPWTRLEQVELQKKAPACAVLRQQVTLPDQDRKD